MAPEPVFPKLKGIDSFTGEIFHSSRWRHDIDLTSRRVAVIGTGASVIQFVPQIQPKVKQLSVFQRTPHWVLPKMDSSLPKPVQLFRFLPLTQQAMRSTVYAIFESLNGGMQSPAAMRQFQRLARFNLHYAIKDPTLRRKLTPNYVIGCKRVLQSNDWYPALAQPNVEVIASGLQEIRGNPRIAAALKQM